MCDTPQKKEIVLQVEPQDAGERLDKWVSVVVDSLTRNAVQKLCEEGNLTMQGRVLDKKYRLQEGDTIVLVLPEPKPLDVIAQNIPLEIVYEDTALLVVNKPKGMVVHPAPGNYDGTLVNALLYHCQGRLSSINGVIRPGIVHRIDKDTSGLLVVAKTDQAHASLAQQIQQHSFDRFYHAVVYGNVKVEQGCVDAPIGRHPVDRKKMCVITQNSKSAITHYHVLEHFSGFTYLQLKLETGRTHQIRVHMEYMGHPVAGDLVYGGRKPITQLSGQCLHAKTIGFLHPETGKEMYFESSLPTYFSEFLNKCSKQ